MSGGAGQAADALGRWGPRALAAMLAGVGGLMFETAMIRRFGLILGNTAGAASLSVGCFVAGLGLGSLLATRGGISDPTAFAGRRYRDVGALILAAIWMLRGFPAVSSGVGSALAAGLVGGPAVLMGAAFPRLFAATSAVGATLLCTLNLAGSVVGAWWAGNRGVPRLGLELTLLLAAAAYGIAALTLRFAGRGERIEPAPLARTSEVSVPELRLAAASGLTLIGFEVLLLRRLPFWLEGFQPTLSAVLAAVLATSALGAAAVALVPSGARGVRWASAALCIAAAGVLLGLHELLGTAIARLPIDSDLGFHLRILAAAVVVAAPVALPAGAVLPLLLARREAAHRDRIAGALFCAQGVGALCGALLVGQLLPCLAPRAFFSITPVVLAVLALCGSPMGIVPRLSWLALVLLAVLFGFGGPGAPWSPNPPIRGSRFDRPEQYRPLDHATDAGVTASAVYDRSQHAMVLFTDEFRAAWTGPGTSYMKVLGHLPFLFRDDLGDVAIIALGTGTTADAVCSWSKPRAIDVVEISPAVLSLADRFAADGPVAGARKATFADDPRVRIRVTDGRRFVQRAAPESLDLVTMEPLLPYAPGTACLYSAEFYAAVARALREDGLCVQWVPTHAMPRSMFRTLLRTFAGGFPHSSVWLVDQSTLLVGSRQGHLPSFADLRRRLAAAPSRARTTLHEAGLVAPRDLNAAFVGVLSTTALADAEVLHDDRPFLEAIGYWSGVERLGFLSDNLAELGMVAGLPAAAGVPDYLASAHWVAQRQARLRALIARNDAVLAAGTAATAEAAAAAALVFAADPRSVLLHQEALRARRTSLETAVRSDGAVATADAARRFVGLDPGSAILQAAAGADLGDLPARRAAVARAVAVDPTLPAVFPAAFGPAAELPADARSPLEDLALLVEGEELARQASGDDPRAVALRAAFGVRVADAILEISRRRPLHETERRSLSEVLDPASLDEYGAAILARGGDLVGELGPCWRIDLDLPETLATAAPSDAQERARVVELLGGRRSAAVAAFLAEFLMDEDAKVRRAAAAALAKSFGDRIVFDPDAPKEARRRAADALRALHNRRP